MTTLIGMVVAVVGFIEIAALVVAWVFLKNWSGE